MYPSLAVYRVDFGPDVILCIPNPADSGANGAAEHAEAVGPLAAAALAGLQENKCVIVARKSLVVPTAVVGALVGLDLVGAAGLLVGKWCSETDCDGRRVAPRARWVVDPLEERALEPSKQCADNAVLVAPGGLLAGAETVRLGLQDLALFVGLVVDLLEGNHAESLVQEAGVLPSCGHVGEGVQHVAEAQLAGVVHVRRLGDQRDVPERRVRRRCVLCGRLRCAKVSWCGRCRAGLRYVCGELVHALGAEDGAELLSHLGGQLVDVAGGGPRRRSRVLHGGRGGGRGVVEESRRCGRRALPGGVSRLRMGTLHSPGSLVDERQGAGAAAGRRP